MKVHSFLGVGEFATLSNEAPGLQLGPLAPALRCTTVLIFVYLSVFVLVILFRTCRRTTAVEPSPLRAMQGLSEPLAPVPMLCLLMICARLRATQLHRGDGHPQPWMPTVMYACTGTYLLLLVSRLVPPSRELDSGPRMLLRCIQGTLLLLVHLAVGIMIFGIVSMQPAATHEEKYPHLPVMNCFLCLVAAYFLLSLLLDILALLNADRSTEPMKTFIERQRLAMEMAPMFSVLLVSMSLRAVQLRMVCSSTAVLAMSVTAIAIMLLSILGLPEPARAVKDDQTDQPSAGLSSARWLLTAVLLLGVTVTLAGVFAMEDTSAALLSLDAASRPPIAVSMWCVMWLVLVYFAVAGISIVLRGLDSVHGKCEKAVEEAHGSLAFAAAMCVVMLAVRLQVVQQHQRDPPRWAQLTMYTATASLTIQCVAAALVARCPAYTDDQSSEGGFAVWAKVGIIALALIRLLALCVMYVAAACLVGALFAVTHELA